MAEELIVISNVYFDTNILISLNLTTPSSDFLNLKDSCDFFETKLLIPELVLKEYINKNKREVFQKFSNIGNDLKTINDRVSSKISFSSPGVNQLVMETEALMKQKIVDLGIGTFKTNISFDELEELALKELSYKEQSMKKSLRDSIVLLSIIEHVKESPKSFNIFIVGDKFFNIAEVESIIESSKVNIKVVRSLLEAREIVDASIVSISKKIRDERERRLKLFLDSQSPLIIKFVRDGQFNPFTLLMEEPNEFPIGTTIDKIKAIDYDSIHGARPPKDFAKEEAKKVKISFMVKAKFTVLIRFYPFPWGNPLRLEQAGEDITPGTAAATYITSSGDAVGTGGLFGYLGQNIREQPILRNISVEASALLKLNEEKQEEYSDLVLERLIT